MSAVDATLCRSSLAGASRLWLVMAVSQLVLLVASSRMCVAGVVASAQIEAAAEVARPTVIPNPIQAVEMASLPVASPTGQFVRSMGGAVPLQDLAPQDSLPDPRSVMTRSLLIPGWGQITNRQPLKVPVIYAAYASAGVYTAYLTQRYHDYRAATYNLSRGPDSDFRFGATPDYIPPNANPSQIKTLRDRYRNRRDLMVLVFGVLHGLNALDAYVYAHMRSFDVSDKLSLRLDIGHGSDWMMYAPLTIADWPARDFATEHSERVQHMERSERTQHREYADRAVLLLPPSNSFLQGVQPLGQLPHSRILLRIDF